MKGSRQHAGDRVVSGPSGAPPPNARAWEVGNVSPVGVLTRYAGALYYDRVTAKGWMCTGSTSSAWVDVGAFYNLVAADFVVADDFDPSVTGLAAPVGSRARTTGGASAWLKYGSGDTAWSALGEIRASVVAPAGGPYSAVDLTIAVPESSAVEIWFRIVGAVTGGDWAHLRMDGAAGTGFVRAEGASLAYPALGIINFDGNVRGGFVLGRSVAGVRHIRGFYASTKGAASCGFFTGMVNAGVIASLGIGAAGTYIAAGSEIRACVRDGGGIL